ncbi:AAWKG family protein, partial [Streptomyces sp. NPDC057694]|uniref:AAWKG family protein n=1 Tax=Streptomyces sp. NPDC057694 TaxID=3346216 RepID=UPI0036C95012
MAVDNWEHTISLLTGWDMPGRDNITGSKGEGGIPWLNVDIKKIDRNIHPQNELLDMGASFQFYTRKGKDDVAMYQATVHYPDLSAGKAFWERGDAALVSLVNNFQSAGASSPYGGDPTVTTGVDLHSFAKTAASFDAAGDFFAKHTETLKQWLESLGKEDAAWKGTAAGVFYDLLDDLHNKYEHFTGELRPPGFSPANQSLAMPGYRSTTLHGDQLIGAELALHNAYSRLYDYHNKFFWRNAQPINVNRADGSTLAHNLPADPRDILNEMMADIAEFITRHNWPNILVNTREVRNGHYGTAEVTKWVAGPDLTSSPIWGDLKDTSTWSAVSNDAIGRWTNNVKTNLDAPARPVVDELREHWSRVLDPSWNTRFAFQDLPGADLAQKYAQDKAQADADKQNDEFGKTIDSLGKGIGGVNKNLDSFGKGLGDFGSGLNKNLDSFGKGIGDVGAGLNKNLGAFGSNLGNFGSNLNKNLDTFGSGLGNLGSGLNSNLNAFGSNLSGIGDGLGNFGKDLNTGLGNFSSSLGTTGSNLNDSLGAFGNNLTTSLLGGATGANGSSGLTTSSGPDYSNLLGDGNLTTTSTPDGATLGGSLVSNPDGSTTTTGPDGLPLTTFPSGMTQTLTGSGKPSVTSPTGSTSVGNDDGSVTTQYPDGSSVTVAPDGTVTTTSPDGVTSTTHLDPGQTLTNPDGSVTGIDAGGGVSTHYPDGSSFTANPDGSTTVTNPDGSSTTQFPDGLTQSVGSDGQVQVTSPDGSVSVPGDDGGMTTQYPDGSSVTVAPDGTVTTTSPDGVTSTTHLDPGQTLTNPDGSVTGIDAGGGVST